MKIIATVITVTILSLTGCASLSQERVDFAYSRCPVLRQYTQEEIKQAAAELKSLPSEAQIVEMMGDYNKLRSACRLAERELEKQR